MFLLQLVCAQHFVYYDFGEKGLDLIH